MSWEAIGAIGQVVSALAFLLAIVQIGHARSDARRAFAQERVDRSIQLNMTSAANERLMAIRAKAIERLRVASGDPLPPFFRAATEQLGLSLEEAFTLASEQMARWTSIAHTISYLPELSQAERAQFERTARVGITEPIFRFWFEHLRSWLDPNAVRYIDGLLAQSSSTSA